MNNRIKQLAEQCREEYPDTEWPDATYYRFDEAKFAELIVRECVESIPADGHRGDFGRAVEFCQQQIKQHFGVES